MSEALPHVRSDHEKVMQSPSVSCELSILRSPEKLNSWADPSGLDLTDTKSDFELVNLWAQKRGIYKQPGYDFTKDPDLIFEGLVRSAFNPDIFLCKLTLWYYTGHALDKEKARKLYYSSTPCLDKFEKDYVMLDFFLQRDECLKKCNGGKVKGGELFLHRFGFCDLYGPLRSWIAACKKKQTLSQSCPLMCKPSLCNNQDLVIILDSCHSGEFARQLHNFLEVMKGIDPTLMNGKTITIQAACGPDERTLGGYFTPLFTHLNDPQNEELMETLKKEWDSMKEEEKSKYSLPDLPSPMVVTTLPQPEGVTMEMNIENFKLTLFPNPGFFKFCLIKVYQHEDFKLFEGKDRVLDKTSAKNFMDSSPFTVLDYKLKTMSTGPYKGNPFGLFLLQDLKDKNKAICAHIHFAKDNTQRCTRINLVHLKKPPIGIMYCLDVDRSDMLQHDSAEDKYKVVVDLDRNAENLVRACRDYVTKQNRTLWYDVKQWNMNKSIHGLFRLKRERTVKEDFYLKGIEEFNLPIVS